MLALQQADAEGHHHRRHAGRPRLPVGDHQRVDEDGQRHQEHPAVAHHRAQLRDALGRQPGHPGARGLQIDLREERQIVEARGDGGGERDLAVGDVEELGDEERGGAHHGRHDLPARGGHGLDRRRHVGRVAGLLHQRNAEGAVDGDVGDRAAGDRPEERGRHHRHLGGAAAIAAHEHERDLHQEAVAAHGVERVAEEDERHQHAGRHLQRHAEDPVDVEVEIADDA